MRLHARTKGRTVQTEPQIVQVAHIFLFRSCGEKIGSPKHKSRFPFWCLLPSAVHKISTQVLILVSWGPEARCLRLHVAQRGPQQGRNRKNMFKSWPFTVGTCLPFRSCRGNIGYANSCKSRCASFFSVVCWQLQAVAKLVFRALSEDQTVSETNVLSCFVGVLVLWGSMRPDAWLALFWDETKQT